MYSTYNQGKSVMAERFIKTFKNKMWKHVTAFSENVYFHVTDDINDEYNTFHKTIKMKPVDVKSNSYAEYNENSKEKIRNLRLVIMLEYQNTKTFLQQVILQIRLKMFLLSAKSKTQFHRLMFHRPRLIAISVVKKLL